MLREALLEIFLYQKKALFASKENINQVEKIKQELNKKDQDKKKKLN